MSVQLSELIYVITPIVAWLTAGVLKYFFNSFRAGSARAGLKLIGYGGFPSNHSAIVSSMAVLIGLQEGFAHPAFGVAFTMALIVMMDANSLRGQVGKQAQAINQLRKLHPTEVTQLRERIGHSKLEIAGGCGVGALVALVVSKSF